jgi:UDP-glucose 4-epimerase
MEALSHGKCGAYNIGTGAGNSVNEVIQVVQRVTGKPLRLRVGPRREGDPAILVASNARLRNELHWQPRYSSLEEIVRSAWKWRTQRPQGYRLGEAEAGVSAAM